MILRPTTSNHFSFPFSFQFFTRLAAVFAEEVGGCGFESFESSIRTRLEGSTKPTKLFRLDNSEESFLVDDGRFEGRVVRCSTNAFP